uniref:Ig-like domain-containing protein n=1 Tax=Larimichthys crocea TaxID=215358 RepID=A0A0F8C2B8_LARCR
MNQEKDAVEVIYTQKTLNPARGSSVKLSCDARYDFKQCGLLHVAWFQNEAELTQPRKYHTTVNETISDQRMRRRQVVTEILNLTPEDSGAFQCRAECQLKDTAMGHLIIINVQGMRNITLAHGGSTKAGP